MLYKLKPVLIAGCCFFFSLWWLGVNNKTSDESDYTHEQCAQDFSKIYYDMAHYSKSRNALTDAIENYQKALEHKSDLLEAYDELGASYEQLGDKNAALQTYFKAMSIDPNFIETRGCAGIMIKSISPEKAQLTGKTPWNGESLEGKTIFIFSEKGLGDTICFARFLPLLIAQGARVLFKPQKSLLKLIEQANFGVELVDHAEDAAMLQYDYYAPLLSLPHLLKISYDNVPGSNGYLHVDEHKVADFKERIFKTDKFKIGIFWQGDHNHPNDKNRSVALSRFYELANIPGVQCYSLQKGYGVEQLDTLPKGISIIRVDQEIKDWTDTAALVKNLDLMVTIDTAPMHLCGAINVPAWLLIPHVIDCRWMVLSEDSSTVWYDSVKKFRQPEPGNWEAVFSNVKTSLLQKIQDHRAFRSVS